MPKSYQARQKYSRIFVSLAQGVLGTIPMMVATEEVRGRCKSLSSAKREWTAVSVRAADFAAVELLRKRFRENTGEDISKPEVMSLLMAEGIAAVAKREEFAAD